MSIKKKLTEKNMYTLAASNKTMQKQVINNKRIIKQ